MKKAALVVLLAAAIVPAAASSQGPTAASGQCFFDRDWRGWKAIDSNAIYIRSGIRDVFKLDFANGCPGITSPNAHLVTSSHTGSICSALDLDVKVSDLQGFSTPCIPTKLTKLSADEAKAIPRNLQP